MFLVFLWSYTCRNNHESLGHLHVRTCSMARDGMSKDDRKMVLIFS